MPALALALLVAFPPLSAGAVAAASTTRPGAPAELVVSVSPAHLTSIDQNAAVFAGLRDAQGRPINEQVPVPVVISVAPDGGKASSAPSGYVTPVDSAIYGTWSDVATFSPGPVAGRVTVTVTAPGLKLSARSVVRVGLQSMLAFAAVPQKPLAAGSTATVAVRLELPDGSPTQDGGRTVTLRVKAPDGTTATLTANDAAGVATFQLTAKRAGLYRLAASAPGALAASGATLTVTPGPPSRLLLTPAPSFVVPPNGSAMLRLEAVDRYGNRVADSFRVALQSSGVGSLRHVVHEADSGQTVAVWNAGGHPGTGTVTASAPGSHLAAARATLTQLAYSADLVAGKGMWLRYQDLKAYGAAAVVARAVQVGITHLYLEVGSTYHHDGFWGARQLDELLPVAHRHHVAVIGWIYDTLYNPAADMALAERAAGYTAPGGQRVDGLALDLETDSTMVPRVLAPFAQELRRTLGPRYPLVAVTYPPQLRPRYPFATLADFFNVIAPMDYWHYDPRLYSGAQAADFVQRSIGELRSLSGLAYMPIAIIGQSYDMFTRSEQGRFSPSGAEIAAAMAAAKAAGAVGFSLYRWGTATAAELAALAGDPWP